MASQTFFDPHSRQAVLAIRWNDDHSVVDVVARDRVVASLGQYDLRRQGMQVALPNGTVAAVRLEATDDGDEWDIRRTGTVLVGGRIDDAPTRSGPSTPPPRLSPSATIGVPGPGAVRTGPPVATAPTAIGLAAASAITSTPTVTGRPVAGPESASLPGSALPGAALPGYRAAPITTPAVERRPDTAVAIRRVSPRAVLPSPRMIGAGAGTPIPAGSWALPAPRSLIDVGPAVDLATVAPVARVVRHSDVVLPRMDEASEPEQLPPTPRFAIPDLSTTALGVIVLICNLVGAFTWGHDVLLALDLLVAIAAGGTLAALGRAFAAEKLDPNGPEPLVAACAASLSLMWAAFHLSDHPATAFAVLVANGSAALLFARVSLSAHAAEISARSRATSAAGALLAA